MPTEIKDIPGYEGRYAINKEGHIWSYVSGRFRIVNPRKDGYRVTRLADNGPHYRVHRLMAHVWLGMPLNSPLDVDHINGNPADNRLENLRIATRSQNLQNQVVRTRYKGVRESGLKWTAKIIVNKQEIYIGTYETAEQAALAYNVLAAANFGSFARLNFIPTLT